MTRYLSLPTITISLLAGLVLTGLVLLPIESQAARKPNQIKVAKVKKIKSYSVKLQWKKKSAATFYKVQLLDSNGTEIHQWKNRTKRFKTIKKRMGHLNIGTSYSYRVKGCNTKGCGSWSTAVQFTTLSADAATDYDEPVANNILALETAVFDGINAYRTSQGLSALQRRANIAAVAREHSAAMANGSVPFSHDGFTDRFKDIQTLNGSRGGGSENVAFATDRPALVDTIVNGWIASEGHRQNIIGNYDLSGIGTAYDPATDRYYFTQLFLANR